MRFILFAIIFSAFAQISFSQKGSSPDDLIQKLDSIGNSQSISSHFATLYSATTKSAMNFFSQQSERSRELVMRLQLRFADIFLNAASAQKRGIKIPDEWVSYFSDNSLSALQYSLLGINIHINENIWEALTSEFTLIEIEELKPSFFHYYTALRKIYEQVYNVAFLSSQQIKQLHFLTFGLDRIYGKMMLKKWRKRQYHLAELYFTDPTTFEKKYKNLRKKVDRTNRLIKKIL